MTWTRRTCGKTITNRKAEHCPECHETFTRTKAGDKPRTGRHGVAEGPDRRRCMTTAELSAKGMTQNSKGYWTTGETFENASESFHR